MPTPTPRFHQLEALFNETVGGLQELPNSSMLLWAAIGCDEGDQLDRVASTLQLRLKFVQNGKRKMSQESITATARMCAVEVLAKVGKAPDRAKEWAKQWHRLLLPEDYTELMRELDATSGEPKAEIKPAALATPPSSPEIQEASPQCSPRQSFDTARPEFEYSAAEAVAASQGEEITAGSRLAGEQQVAGRGGGSSQDSPWSQQMLAYLHEAVPDALKQMSTEQLALGGIAGAAVLFSLYCERKAISRSLRRASRNYLGI